MTKPISHYIWAAVLAISAVAVSVAGTKARLPIGPIVAVSLVLLLLAAGSLRSQGHPRGTSRRFWVLLAVGGLFLVGGALGLIRSFLEHRGVAEVAPLGIPLALGLYITWFAFRTRQRASHDG